MLRVLCGRPLTSAVLLRRKAIETALTITAAAFHTGLPSYFTHRDLFPSLMKVWPRANHKTPYSWRLAIVYPRL